jgi:hypothetical protein
VQYFRNPVRPGEEVEISVDMAAPGTAGAYQSNWKLRDGNGVLFGLGPAGDSPFWVKVEVYAPQATATPTSVPTSTSVPAIYASGNAVLKLNDRLDLDTGGANPTGGVDFTFVKNADQKLVFAPEKNVEIAYFGETIPNMADCDSLIMKNEAVSLETVKESASFCYHTNQGLPGYLAFGIQDLGKEELKVIFTTWSKP